MENKKLYSTLTVKAIDNDERIIKGIASTPSADRDGDIIDPNGATFSLPYPLLSQHDHNSPIGEVIQSNITSKGIEITAKISKNSGLDYIDDTWKKIKAGLIKGLSIGFRPLEYSEIDTGIHFKKYEIFELSAVTVPANREASILSIKTICTSKDCQNDSVELDIKRANVRKKAAVTLAKLKLNKGK